MGLSVKSNEMSMRREIGSREIRWKMRIKCGDSIFAVWEEHGLRIFTYVHTVFESCYMIAIHMIDFGTIPLPSITFEVQKIVSAVCVVSALCLLCVCTLVCSCLHFVCIGLHQIADNATQRTITA